ncbi:MAG: thioredoxin domain-containing protein [Marinifilaceae bacterium]
MKTHKHTNKLIHESSPYLLQHAHNPVNWYPWGTEALEKARLESKVILISIGYAACHWCHVMERESFEDEQMAALMNEFFVCIKVDREERPDIDHIYMDAVQLMTGRGGWPLNCFALPDGRPFFGGTYFRPQDWRKILYGVRNAFQNDYEKVVKAATQINEGIRTMNLVDIRQNQTGMEISSLKLPYQAWKKNFDSREGGNQGAPKFPLSNSYEFLLRYYHYTGDQSALKHVVRSLEKMARGGIYDQIGGGFARYSTDAEWLVPHFEKMLYDNAQLVSLYSEAYQLTKNPLYRKVVEQSIDFVNRELSLPEGGFLSSLDADSEGVEGKFYVWSSKEIDNALGVDASIFKEYFGVSEKGNWEHTNILWQARAQKEVMEKFGLDENRFEEIIENSVKKLFQERSKRVRPGLDDKVLTSWNAMMLKALVDAYKALEKEEYLSRALKNANFILEHMLKNRAHLHRNYKDGESGINGFLDDYSFTIEAFVALYQVTFDLQWLQLADDLLQIVLQHYFDEKSGMFYYTSDEDPKLIVRKIELIDNVIPSSNSSLAKGLFLLGNYLGNDDYLNKARQMVLNVQDRMERTLPYHSNWGILFLFLAESPFELAIVGKDAVEKSRHLHRNFLPDVLIYGSEGEGELPLLENRYVKNKTMLYLCKDKSCKLPVTDVEQLLDQLKTARTEVKQP